MRGSETGSLREIPLGLGMMGTSGSAAGVSSLGEGVFLFSPFASFEERLALDFLEASSARRGMESAK